MAGERHRDEALTARTDALDAELAQLLDVRPSGEFAARVRQRVQAEPARRWRWAWPLAAAAAMIAVIVFASVARTPDSPNVAGLAPTPGAPDSPNVGAGLTPVPPAFARAVATPRAGRPQGPPPLRTPPARSETVVIVDQRQRAALNRMMQLVEEGKLDSTMLETPRSAALPLEANVDIAPLIVPPLEVLPMPGASPIEKTVERN